MDELKALLRDIETLRNNLNKLVSDNNNLQDPEIVAASHTLNSAISKYNTLIKKKTK